MCRRLPKVTGITKNQKNMTPPKEHSKYPVIDPKEMMIHELPDKECKIIVLKVLREPQENTDKQFKEIKETIQKNEKFNKEIENIKRTKRNLGAQKYNDWPKDSIESFNIRLNQTRERINEHEGTPFENIQLE